MAKKSNPRHTRVRTKSGKQSFWESFRERAFSEKIMAGCGIIIAISLVATTFLIVGANIGAH